MADGGVPDTTKAAPAEKKTEAGTQTCAAGDFSAACKAKIAQTEPKPATPEKPVAAPKPTANNALPQSAPAGVSLQPPPQNGAVSIDPKIEEQIRQRAHQLYLDTRAGKGPVPQIRQDIAKGPQVDLSLKENKKWIDENPLTGVHAEQFQQAYRAWKASGGTGTPPWGLLATSVKEGWSDARPEPSRKITAPDANSARAMWRSHFYFGNMGLDHFIDHKPQATGDNTASFGVADAAGHQSAFEGKANAVEPGLAAKIDAELKVTGNPQDGFVVEPTSRFYELSLRLTGSYFQENMKRVEGQDPRLAYARWNMGPARYAQFVASAEQHRLEEKYKKPDGSAPSVAEWAFETPIQDKEYAQVRRNALRFWEYWNTYKTVYEGL